MNRMKFATCLGLVLACTLARAANTWQLVVDVGAKRVTITNTVAVRESVPVQLVHLGGTTASNLIMQLQLRDGTLMAQAAGFTAGTNDNATGSISLNTLPLVAFFTNLTAQSVRAFNCVIVDTNLSRLLVNDVVGIQNNPYVPGMPDPTPVEQAYWSQWIAVALTNITASWSTNSSDVVARGMATAAAYTAGVARTEAAAALAAANGITLASLGAGSAATHAATDFATSAQGLLASTAVQPSALTNYPTLTAFNAQAQDVADLHSQANILNTGKVDLVTWRTGSNALSGATATAQASANAAGLTATNAQTLAATAVQPAALAPYALVSSVPTNAAQIGGLTNAAAFDQYGAAASLTQSIATAQGRADNAYQLALTNNAGAITNSSSALASFTLSSLNGVVVLSNSPNYHHAYWQGGGSSGMLWQSTAGSGLGALIDPATLTGPAFTAATNAAASATLASNLAASANARATVGSTLGVAVYGTSVYFPNSNLTYKLNFNGIGTNQYIEGPSMCAWGQGYMVATRVGPGPDSGIGDAVLLTLNANGDVVTTNTLYHDAGGYDTENTVIERTASNTILVAYNLYHWQDDTQPTNSLRMLRSTDLVTWTTNTIYCAGYVSRFAGAMAQVAGGKIILPYYKQLTNGGPFVAYTQTSTDDGVTWGNETLLAMLAPMSLQEPELTYLGNSNILASIRNNTGSGISNYISRSYDNGATWTTPTNAFCAVSKIAVTRMGNGLLVASYRGGRANQQSYRVSNDNGATWSAERDIDTRYYLTAYSSGAESPTTPGLISCVYSYQTDASGTNCPLYFRQGAFAGIATTGEQLGPVDVVASNAATAALVGTKLSANTLLHVTAAGSGTVLTSATNSTIVTDTLSVSGSGGITTNAVLIAPTISSATNSGASYFTQPPLLTNGQPVATWCIGANPAQSPTLASNATGTGVTFYVPRGATNAVWFYGRADVPTNIPQSAISNIVLCVAIMSNGGGTATELQVPISSGDYIGTSFAGYRQYNINRAISGILPYTATGFTAVSVYWKNLGFAGSTVGACYLIGSLEMAR